MKTKRWIPHTRCVGAPVCPHCHKKLSEKDWYVSLHRYEIEPVECIKCGKYFAARAVVTWEARKLTKRQLNRID